MDVYIIYENLYKIIQLFFEHHLRHLNKYAYGIFHTKMTTYSSQIIQYAEEPLCV
jgi:hypothetical protein